ncbi:right-handed parallel beta-helix repeat-containing protein [Streptomyces sp. NPDC020125]|uniref:right-handed parallel beta-helix repeat-containing protein n=1 Tax=Streptomyces sp. NPDC020125 TaxID=3154593 RepID=UPI0033F76BA5
MHHRRVRRLSIWVAGAALLGAGAFTVLPGAEGHAEPAAAAGSEATAAAEAGARTPFATVEAECGTLGGGAKVHAIKPGDPAPTKATPETEASGYAYAKLDRTLARNTGDDSFAVYSDSGTKGDNGQLSGARVLNNTAIAPWWANGLRIAGGKDIQFKNNLVKSVSSNSTLEVGVFGDSGHPLESATVSGNVLLGGGGWNGIRHGVQIGSPSPTSNFPDAFTNVTMTDNVMRGALRAGLFIAKQNVKVTLRSYIEYWTPTGPASRPISICAWRALPPR